MQRWRSIEKWKEPGDSTVEKSTKQKQTHKYKEQIGGFQSGVAWGDGQNW